MKSLPLLLLFPNDPLQPKQADPVFAEEVAVAQAVQLPVAWLDFPGAMMTCELKKIPPARVLYRGWMVDRAEYRCFYRDLIDASHQAFTKPNAYELCHYAPNSWQFVRNIAPKFFFFPEAAIPQEHYLENQYELLKPQLALAPLIVKDYVKSEKAHWDEACFIPKGATWEQFERVVRNFLTYRGNRFTGGLVFKEYLTLTAGVEYRLWVLNRQLLHVSQNTGPTTAKNLGIYPDLRRFEPYFNKIASPFYTMDVALSEELGWVVIELGDGQVSGYNCDGNNVEAFYRALKHAVDDG